MLTSLIAFVVAAVLLGGDVASHVLPLTLIAISGAWLLGVAIERGGLAAARRLWWPGQVMLAGWLLLPILQLCPLPPSWWRALPGRSLAAQTLDAASAGAAWHPITLDVSTTVLAAASFLWLAGVTLAALVLTPEQVRRVFLAIFVLGLATIAVGFIQVLSHGGLLRFYAFAHFGALLGFFTNKNHAGLFLALAMLAGFAAFRRDLFVRRQSLALIAPAALLFLAALVATYSRAGLFLGLLAIAIMALMAREQKLGTGAKRLAVAGLGVLGIVLVLASSDLGARALGRFGSIAEDGRWQFWTWSWPLARQLFPIGGGLGAFPSLFTPTEQLAWVRPTQLNHAHNDYIELLIEAGAAGMVLVALTLVVFARQLREAWLDRALTEGRQAVIAAAMVGLCAIHSVVDYPLRRMAIAVVFAFAWGVLLRAGGAKPIADPR